MKDAFPLIAALPAFVVILFANTPSRAASVIKGRGHPLNIDWDPAPAPEDGPPLSAGALRDKAFLPAEIGGIVGAYALVVTLIFLTLLLAGQRLRKLHKKASTPRETEMLTTFPVDSQYCPPTVSPLSGATVSKNFSWPSPEKNEPSPYIFPNQNASPISQCGSAVDAKTLEVDKQHLEQGLSDLYAHVMEQEEAKARGLSIADMPKPYPPPSISPQRGNKSSSLIRRMEKPNPITLTAPIVSHSRTSSLMSSIKSPKRKGIRGMKISSPIPTPLSATFPAQYASDEEPLTPRYYHHHPPPPLPKDNNPYQRTQEPYPSQPYNNHSRNASSVNTATNPSPISPTRSIAEQMTSLSIRPLPNNRSIGTSRPPNLIIPGSAANPPPVNNKHTAGNPTRQLPFRAFDPPPGLSSPSFSHSTKTTVLERTVPLPSGLKTPWSAGAVPYTPYQPFTPLVPVTPRLVTREDRKAMKRMEPKSPVMEMVASEEELWDGGY